MEAPVPDMRAPFPVMQDLGIAATAASNAVLTALEVAAVLELVLAVESERRTAPLADVVAGLIAIVGLTPAVIVRGRSAVRDCNAVPPEAAVIRPCASIVKVGLL
jgi:hypothetical protein